MTPDDPRHGTNAGRSAGCRCPACKAAKVKYEKRRLAGLCGGTATLTDATGTKRRIHALMAIGWPSSEVAARLGVHESRVIGITRAMRVTHRTHAKVKAVYDQLCMTPGPSRKNSARAKSAGWVPPLAWDDEAIDNPAAEPWKPSEDAAELFDEVVVLRAMKGQRVSANRAERMEAILRWRESGRPLQELERIQHWNTRRDLRGAA